jgi:hypothetical protein
MQRRFPIDTRDANRQESVLRSHVKLGRAHRRAYEDPHGDASVREYRAPRTDEDGRYHNGEPTHEEAVADTAHETE